MGKGSRSREANKAEASKAAQNVQSKSGGKTLRNILIGLVVLAFAGVGIFGLLSNTSVLMDKIDAYQVGDMKINALEYRIYYKNAEMDLISNYGTTLQLYYGVDLSRPLATQAYGDGTWGDYLHENTKSTLFEVYSLYQEALSNGAEKVTKDNTTYKGLMASYRAMADMYDMELDAYIKAVYGSAVKLADIQEATLVRATATDYYENYIDELGVTASDLSAFYAENKAEFDVADYNSFAFKYETVKYTEHEHEEGEEEEPGIAESEEEATAMTEANKAAAQAKADEFVSRLKSGESFIALAREYAEDATEFEDEDSVLTTGSVLNSESPTDMETWLANDARNADDVTTIETSNAINVVRFIKRYLPEEKTLTVRHILLSVDAADDDATEEEKAEAEKLDAETKEKIEAIYEEWKSGEMTEDSFADLAMQYSADYGSVKTGGKISDFTQGAMVAEFDAWSFDSSRKYGDTAIVKTSYGYHLIYFVGEGDLDWVNDARNTLEGEKYDAYYETLSDVYPINDDFGYGQSLVS